MFLRAACARIYWTKGQKRTGTEAFERFQQISILFLKPYFVLPLIMNSLAYTTPPSCHPGNATS
jgi:hypothetical protein